MRLKHFSINQEKPRKRFGLFFHKPNKKNENILLGFFHSSLIPERGRSAPEKLYHMLMWFVNSKNANFLKKFLNPIIDNRIKTCYNIIGGAFLGRANAPHFIIHQTRPHCQVESCTKKIFIFVYFVY
jgi:hypothetical protein